MAKSEPKPCSCKPGIPQTRTANQLPPRPRISGGAPVRAPLTVLLPPEVQRQHLLAVALHVAERAVQVGVHLPARLLPRAGRILAVVVRRLRSLLRPAAGSSVLLAIRRRFRARRGGAVPRRLQCGGDGPPVHPAGQVLLQVLRAGRVHMADGAAMFPEPLLPLLDWWTCRVQLPLHPGGCSFVRRLFQRKLVVTEKCISIKKKWTEQEACVFMMCAVH